MIFLMNFSIVFHLMDRYLYAASSLFITHLFKKTTKLNHAPQSGTENLYVGKQIFDEPE